MPSGAGRRRRFHAAVTHGRWTEVGERVFVGRYRFFDQHIGAILTDDGPVVIDTRSTAGQAREILDDLRAMTAAPGRGGRSTPTITSTTPSATPPSGRRRSGGTPGAPSVLRARRPRTSPEIAGRDAADRGRAGRRRCSTRPTGRSATRAPTSSSAAAGSSCATSVAGHTDDDIVIVVPDADVLFAGDLVENGAPAVLRRRLPARLAGHAAGDPAARRGARSCRATATWPTWPSSTGRSPRSGRSPIWRGGSAAGDARPRRRDRRGAVPAPTTPARRSSAGWLRRAASSTRGEPRSRPPCRRPPPVPPAR